ncbi:hypothetical protein HpHA50_08240 [Helicobacter pylori]|nr:50S ribosome-binding GTPase [Helicobacter pylori]
MKNIYLDVKANIENLQNIFKNTDNENERLKKFNQEALEVFQKLESESLKELESLKNNEEWENFTIAFYGETGAGKSTLIECLRLFFKEQSKVVQQERFKRLYSNYQNNYQNDERNKQPILNELHSLQDGAIIGDGRSDFTLKTRSYSFQYNHQNFILLDVPGIEGSEKKVIDQISNATQKAHAIFYVTKTPNPPQKGEERKRGTIEKIQRQLDSQTEVWAIFNKPINNQRAFKDGLIDESEKESLKILNKEMKNILGEHYMGYKAVSAQAAFSAFYEIDQFKSDLRKKMYAHINKNIEDEECKEIFKNELKQRETKLIENIERRFKECEERFRGSIGKNIEQFEERIKDSLIMLERINIDSGFDFSFNIDSGIDGFALGASIVGLVVVGIVNIWNPVGWVELSIAVLVPLVAAVKASWNVFDSDYKKSQQRKEMNKNLDKACEKIAEAVKSRIESYKKGASEMIENLKASFNDLIVCYERMREGLIKAGEDLWHLDNRIKTTLKNKGARNEE